LSTSTTQHGRLYRLHRWKEASKRFLARPENALCRPCRARGKVVASREVHHEPYHGGDPVAFWDERTWVPICRPCHSSRTRAEELETRTGKPQLQRGCDVHGVPLDPNHFWNRG
jgi:5-methylcytosine-specific restriction enzyme A